MKTVPFKGFGGFGVYVDGVDFDHLTEEEWLEIGKLHLKSLVTIVRGANVSPESITRWTDLWGVRRYSSLFDMCKKYPDVPGRKVIERALRKHASIDPDDIELVQNRFKTKGPGGVQRVTDIRDKNGDYTGIFPSGELYWHSNESGNLIFAPGVALLGQKNMVGSSTGFMQTADYYMDIADSFRRELDDLVLIHRYQEGRLHEKNLEDQDRLMKKHFSPEEETRIPLVIESPGGIRGLHFSLNTADRFEGMDRQSSELLMEKLRGDLATDKYTYDHWYQADNDWVFFDNSITNHRRQGQVKDRLALRIQQGYENLQADDYNPYLQTEFAREYEVRLESLEAFMAANFAAPDRGSMRAGTSKTL